MRLSQKLITYVFLIISTICVSAAIAQEAVSVEGARIDDDSSMLQSLVIVTEGKMLKYSISGTYESGLNVVELVAEDRLVNHKQCYATQDCSVSGVYTLQSDSSTIMMAVIIAEDGKQHSERIKVRPSSGTKVYFIGSAPGMNGMQFTTPEVLASATGTQELAIAEKSRLDAYMPEPRLSSEGPELKVDVVMETENSYAVSVLSRDVAGIEFIEILENGTFMDVEICNGKTKCEYKKVLRNKKPGRNKYMVKSMNMSGALTFQEQLLFFTEPTE